MTSTNVRHLVLDEYIVRPRMLAYASALNEIPGWFIMPDILLFQKIDHMQLREGLKGDLFEIGAYQGKSAILLGLLHRDGERLVVCDLFESAAAPTEANWIENQTFYKGLTRRIFEENYLTFHDDLPLILPCSSTDLGRYNLARSFRFIHIDGSHLYDVVRVDIETAKGLLIDGGVVAFDDFTAPATPGVAAAVWEEVINGGLMPFCYTHKLYGAWNGANSERLAELRKWAIEHPFLQVESHLVFGQELLHITMKTMNAPKPSVDQTLVWSPLPPVLVKLARFLLRSVRRYRRARSS